MSDRADDTHRPERLAVLAAKHWGDYWESDTLKGQTRSGATEGKILAPLRRHSLTKGLLLKRVQRKALGILLRHNREGHHRVAKWGYCLPAVLSVGRVLKRAQRATHSSLVRIKVLGMSIETKQQ
jgi:hypothetical protein